MSPEKIRIAIAELCGWRRSTYEKEGRIGIGSFPVWVSPKGFIFDDYTEAERGNFSHLPQAIPDYLNDPKAMQNVVSVEIDPHYIEEYSANLLDILVRDWTRRRWNLFSEHGRNYAFSEATTLQRAEAFLKVFKKWEY